MPIDPIRFNLATHAGSPQKPVPASTSGAPVDVPMAADQLKLAIRQVVKEGEAPAEPYRVLPPEGVSEPKKKTFKLGLGMNLDESTRLELNASLKKGGTVKIELNKKL